MDEVSLCPRYSFEMIKNKPPGRVRTKGDKIKTAMLSDDNPRRDRRSLPPTVTLQQQLAKDTARFHRALVFTQY
jgi:hypothetical protein